jgi:hypothetical protein
MKRNRNILSFKKLLMAALVLPMVQGVGCVYDPTQFAAFLSSQFYQLASNGFQNGIGLALDKYLIWPHF